MLKSTEKRKVKYEGGSDQGTGDGIKRLVQMQRAYRMGCLWDVCVCWGTARGEGE